MATTNVPDDLKNKVKDSYDTIAKRYNAEYELEGEYTRVNYLNKLIKRFQDAGKSEVTVLELGCGGGIPGTKMMLENETPSFHVTANDLSQTQIDYTRSNLEAYADRLTLVQGDMLGLSFEDESLDAVVGFYSIIHLPREEQTQLVQKIAKWLKPGGFFLANFGEEELDGTVQVDWLGAWMYWSGWGAEGSLKMVEAAGLEVVDKDIQRREDINNDAPFLWILANKGKP